jgi:phage terminase large subunit-like protein
LGRTVKKVPARDFPAIAKKYASDVLCGSIPACKWTKLACGRHLEDLQRKRWDYSFEEDKASRVCRFIELLPHVKGKWSSVTIELQPWQIFILCVVFGWITKKGTRRFRTCYIEVARKNGKSALISGIGLYLLAADDEPGAEVYSAATTRDQARIVFETAKKMAERTPGLRNRFGVEAGAHAVTVPAKACTFQALSSDAHTLEGLNVHGGLIDELHAHPTRAVWDVIESATGARSQSLICTITTAGSNRAGICYEQREYVSKILQKVFTDETYFGVIYTLDDEDKWEDEANWIKANPNYGVSVNPEDLQRKARKAIQMPSAVNNFLTKHLDCWVTSDVGLFDMVAWEKCGDPKLKPEDFADCPCYIAMDLGFVSDIASVIKCFVKEEKDEDGESFWMPYFFGRHYLPEDAADDSRNSQYSGWKRAERITVTDGQVTDLEVIIDDVMSDIEKYDVREVSYDPYGELALLNILKRRGMSIDRLIAFPQQVATLSPPTEALMKRVISRAVRHDGCPVLSWAMSNVIGKFDAKGNVYPRKEREENKIDPAIASIMAFGRALQAEGGSVYDGRGVLVI